MRYATAPLSTECRGETSWPQNVLKIWLVLIIDRTSLLIKSLSKLFEFSDNLGSYLTGQFVTNASIYEYASNIGECVGLSYLYCTVMTVLTVFNI